VVTEEIGSHRGNVTMAPFAEFIEAHTALIILLLYAVALLAMGIKSKRGGKR
jgi:hypothetical protein